MIAANQIINHTPESSDAPELAGSTEVNPRVIRVKAIVDYLGAMLLMIPAAPLMVVSMILVKLTSKGPAIYTQTRLGHGGRPFTIFKIRTMNQDSERTTGACWSFGNDPRVTPLGRFLRRTHLDELPQLVNVFRGEMSLVGPRPERPEFVDQLKAAIPRYVERLAVRPGVTGLAQIQLPPDTDLASVSRKLTYDLCYVERISLWLDLRIMACTAFGLLGIPHPASCKLLGVPNPDDFRLTSSHPLGGLNSCFSRAAKP